MKDQNTFLISIIEVGFPGAAFLIAGCSAHATHGYRVHDAGYNDDHVYDRNEEVYYN